MNGETDHLMPDDRRVLSPAEFAAAAGLTEPELRELQDYRLLNPAELDLRTALALREARTLGTDFDLDLFTAGLLARYIRQVGELRSEVQRLRAQSAARSVYTEVSYTAVHVHGAG
ncbi:hypothetical protein [Ramlibacter sp. AN1133]|uniref:hypothetical protein n=1 Tax=Ramlibacter sp. AN1133 TaxID=3133429 RepID=UPI0030BCF499